MCLEHFLKDHLEDDALAWYMTSQTTIATFNEFKEKFLTRFHGSKHDQLIYEELNCGKYFEKQQLSPTEYFSRMVIRARACQSKLEDAYICKALGLNFGPKIKDIFIYQGIDNIDRFMQLLEDVGKEKIIRSREPQRTRDFVPKRAYTSEMSRDHNGYQGPSHREEIPRPKKWIQRDYYKSREYTNEEKGYKKPYSPQKHKGARHVNQLQIEEENQRRGPVKQGRGRWSPPRSNCSDKEIDSEEGEKEERKHLEFKKRITTIRTVNEIRKLGILIWA